MISEGNGATPPKGPDTLAGFLRLNANRFPDRPALREKLFGIWQSWTWAEMDQIARELALGLDQLGLKRGERMAIIGTNRPMLYMTIAAAQILGVVPVPVYQDAVAGEMRFVLEHAGVSFIIAEDQEQVDKVLEISEHLPSLRHVCYDNRRSMRNYDHTTLHDLETVRQTGAGLLAGQEGQRQVEAWIDAGQGSDPCVILYTSGTTGNPKGVVLTQQAILVTTANSVEFDRLVHTEEVVAYLPMAWVGDFMFSIAQSWYCGFCVSCPESADTLAQDLREIGPTYYFAPPRVYESLLSMSQIRMEDSHPLKQRLWRRLIGHAERHGGDILDGKPVGLWNRVVYAVGDFLIYGPLRNVLGLSRVRVAYTAGEAIGPEIFSFFRSLGINLKQLYGQTEASVFIAQQPDGQVMDDTVGVPSPDVEIQVDPETNEVLYRSPGVFQEYYLNPDATSETLTGDGWVRTGDAGFIDQRNGHLRIIDRARDVGKLRCGSMFAPKYVENKLKFFPSILEAVAIGDGRDDVAVMVNIDAHAVGAWAERRKIAYTSYQELASLPEVYQLVEEAILEANRSIAEDPHMQACQIQRFLILHKELDADDGELTRTRKLRRSAIAERYHDVIQALYSGQDQVYADIQVTYEDGRTGQIAGNLAIRNIGAPAQSSVLAA